MCFSVVVVYVPKANNKKLEDLKIFAHAGAYKWCRSVHTYRFLSSICLANYVSEFVKSL
jgi:hypothetical protein